MGADAELGYLPTTAPDVAVNPHPVSKRRKRTAKFLTLLAVLAVAQLLLLPGSPTEQTHPVPQNAASTLARCASLQEVPSPPRDFLKRAASDRFVEGTQAVLIRNAKVWTGGENGTEVLSGDVYLDKGVVKGVGHLGGNLDIQALVAKGKVSIVDAKGAWVTPGIVDPHSHLGDGSSPYMDGASPDDNSRKGPILPWLRSLDGLNTHDDSYPLSIAGGVTTALVLPGSANAIGGQAFTIKLRPTKERSPTSLLVEPPYDILNASASQHGAPLRWRQMKHACGENPSRVYGNSRMDTFWAFREAYNKAREIKNEQDAFCAKAVKGQWTGLGDFPENLQWEALVDVLRGRVRVQTHCYEAVDLDDLIRLSNEFQFPIAAVHHAHEAYLVPDVLKRAYGSTPAVAIFATNARYKREAYRGSEFAARILADNGLKVVMKSDHPVLNSRYLLYEAQQAHYYGLPENLALAAVTSHAAQVIGLDHRVGYLKEGYDADLVVWDSHPLALGATPAQVYIDGIPQIADPQVVHKPSAYQKPPKVPNFDEETAETIKYEGLPPLLPKKAPTDGVLFVNISKIFLPREGTLLEAYATSSVDPDGAVMLVMNGSVQCYGAASDCPHKGAVSEVVEVVGLGGGTIQPGLLSYGSPLGLQEIEAESTTGDGRVFDPLVGPVPKVLGGDDTLIRAVDGLQFAGRSALLAYRAGVTKAITAPSHRGFWAGLGTSFSLGALHKLEEGAVIQEVTALHVAVGHFGRQPSVSTQIAALRKLLLALPDDDDLSISANHFAKVATGKIPIVVEAHSADIIATLILLKKEVEEKTGASIQLTIAGATEAHLLAKELAEAKVGVIFVPSRPFPAVWEQVRVLPGPPLTEESQISLLLAHNVTVGVGVEESWSARNTRFDVAWAAIEAGGRISKLEALALASTNLEKLLGGTAEVALGMPDLVATAGGDLLSFESKVVGVISARRQAVDLF
ncbi:carbohydrate esterase family 9 protein [Auriscalpium vulgare]|uniref:Carbohydrate esterase family 9 protein n=1 Tax=Auriscalpium vulgare TaxID=40419 RepID=A0ACB8R475_9AGAM|nr:carbohydrate esterase family 9 protein [Auriscalpium vulgare]